MMLFLVVNVSKRLRRFEDNDSWDNIGTDVF